MKKFAHNKVKMMKSLLPKVKNSRGFTLIELLVVIAVIGILAAVVLLAINPGEQLARGRDTSRQNAISQMGSSLMAYYTSRGAEFPAEADWMTTLQGSQDLASLPQNPDYSDSNMACATNEMGGFCYDTSTQPSNNAIIYARLEADLNADKCTTTGEVPWYVFSSADGRSGIVCSASEPTSGPQTFVP